MSNFKEGYSLGKGEVHSSILCGSTTKPNKISPFQRCSSALDVATAQNEARNAQVKLWRKRGVCSADVHGWAPAFNANTSPYSVTGATNGQA